jgi:hypothetical protein
MAEPIGTDDKGIDASIGNLSPEDLRDLDNVDVAALEREHPELMPFYKSLQAGATDKFQSAAATLKEGQEMLGRFGEMTPEQVQALITYSQQAKGVFDAFESAGVNMEDLYQREVHGAGAEGSNDSADPYDIYSDPDQLRKVVESTIDSKLGNFAGHIDSVKDEVRNYLRDHSSLSDQLTSMRLEHRDDKNFVPEDVLVKAGELNTPDLRLAADALYGDRWEEEKFATRLAKEKEGWEAEQAQKNLDVETDFRSAEGSAHTPREPEGGDESLHSRVLKDMVENKGFNVNDFATSGTLIRGKGM